MTVHSSSQWNWTDPLDEFPYDEVVGAVETHGRREPQCYGIFCPTDAVISNVGIVLRSIGKKKLTREDVEEFITPTDKFEYRDKAVSITVKVLKMLEAFQDEDDA